MNKIILDLNTSSNENLLETICSEITKTTQVVFNASENNNIFSKLLESWTSLNYNDFLAQRRAIVIQIIYLPSFLCFCAWSLNLSFVLSDSDESKLPLIASSLSFDDFNEEYSKEKKKIFLPFSYLKLLCLLVIEEAGGGRGSLPTQTGELRVKKRGAGWEDVCERN